MGKKLNENLLIYYLIISFKQTQINF